MLNSTATCSPAPGCAAGTGAQVSGKPGPDSRELHAQQPQIRNYPNSRPLEDGRDKLPQRIPRGVTKRLLLRRARDCLRLGTEPKQPRVHTVRPHCYQVKPGRTERRVASRLLSPRPCATPGPCGAGKGPGPPGSAGQEVTPTARLQMAGTCLMPGVSSAAQSLAWSRCPVTSLLNARTPFVRPLQQK